VHITVGASWLVSVTDGALDGVGHLGHKLRFIRLKTLAEAFVDGREGHVLGRRSGRHVFSSGYDAVKDESVVKVAADGR